MSGQALDLKRSAQIVWRLKRLVVAIIALGVMAGVGYTVLTPAVYVSTTIVVLSPRTPIGSQAAVVTSPQVLSAALTSVDRGMSLTALQNRIQIRSAAVGLMAITAGGETPGQAIETANAVTRSYIAYVGTSGSVTGPLPVRLFESAASASGTSLSWRLFYAAGTGLLAGILTGVVTALAIGRVNPRLRERDEIADSIGVPVLASVQVKPPAKPAGWTKLLDEYEPLAADAWRLRKLLRELGHAGPDTAGLAAGNGSSVAVLSISGDHRALALGPQLAAFAASQGVPAALVLDSRSRREAKVTTALRAACAAAQGSRGPGRLPVSVIENDGGALPAGVLAVVVAVVDGRTPRVAGTMRAATTLLGVASGAVTAQQLARVAASAAGDGRDIAGIVVAGPDPADETTGRLPQLARLGQHRMPRRMTTAVMEIRQ
jgi:capsular polysaccharide biosynthesis protein